MRLINLLNRREQGCDRKGGQKTLGPLGGDSGRLCGEMKPVGGLEREQL